MSSPITIPKTGKTPSSSPAREQGLDRVPGNSASPLDRAPILSPKPTNDGLEDQESAAVPEVRGIGHSIAAFVQSFSPLSVHEAPSPLSSSNPPRSSLADSNGSIRRSQGNNEFRTVVSFGSGSPSGSLSGKASPSSSLHMRSTSGTPPATSSGPVHFGDFEDGFVKIEQLPALSSSPAQGLPITIPNDPTQPKAESPSTNLLGASTLWSASSASASESQGMSSSLFTSLGSWFSKREITGRFQIELGTSIKQAPDHLQESDGSQQHSEPKDEFLSAKFEISKENLSNVDQIIVQKLMMLFGEAQRSLLAQGAIAEMVASPSFSNTSAPSLGVPPTSIPQSQAIFAEALQSSLFTSSSNLNSKMESAVEWTLQARPRGYGYKGIGKLLRLICIVCQEPYDLHLTHVPLFLHSVPQLEILELRHHHMATIPVFTFYISHRLKRVILADNKIKTLFSETPKAQLVGLIPVGTQATYTSSESTSESQAKADSHPFGASSTDSSAQEAKKPDSPQDSIGDPLRKTDLLEHLSSPLNYFAALQSPSIEYLDLSGNLIVSIPSFIGFFKHLHTLNLARNQLTALPTELSTIPVLHELIIDNNYIYDLPAMKQLTKLSWKSNGLKAGLTTWNSRSILPCLSHLSSLTSIDLSGNFLDQLPSSLVSIAKNISKLVISSNLIYQLDGKDISQFTSLNFFEIASNKLKALPNELFHLPLTHLDVSDNLLVAIPVPLNSIAGTLEVLKLAKNQIKSLPYNLLHQVDNFEGIFIKHKEIQQFNRLNKLDLSHNKLSELPEMFEELGSTLTSLDISNNLLSSMPQSTAALISLKTLNASNNKFETFSTVGHMRNLSSLNLEGNDALMTLPRTFVELSELNELVLAQVKLTRTHLKSSSTWHYDVLPLKPITDKLFVDRVPQLLSLTRSATHALLLRVLHFLCKQPLFHTSLLNQSLLFNLLSAAKSVSLEMEYEACIAQGQEQISTLMAIRHLTKNLDLHAMLMENARPMVTVLSEHVLQQATLMDSMQSEFYDSGGHQLGKSASTVRLSEIGDSYDSQSSSASNSSSQMGHSSGFSAFTPRASRHTQLLRLQNKVRVSLTGLCLDAMCYLSWTPAFRDAMNETPGLVDAVKKLKSHVDHEIFERSRRTLAGLGVAPEFKENRGVRILTLDGGGTRGITAVIMLKRIEEITGRRLHELFDLMVGTSTGALIATLTSWTRLSMLEAVTYYREACGIIFAPRGTGVLESKYTVPISEAPQPNNAQVAKILSLAYELEPDALLKIVPPTMSKVKKVLSTSASTVPLLAPSLASSSSSSQLASDAINPTAASESVSAEAAAHPAGISASWTGPSPWARIGGFFGMISTRSFYDTAPLEMVLKNLGDPQATLLDTAANGDLRIIFTSTEVGVYPPQNYLLRNYCYKNDSQSKYEGTSSLTMWEAMRCTTAAPAYFDSYTINGRRLADGGISNNNPTAIAVQEAKALWPERKLDVVLSVGVGLKPPKPVPQSMANVFSALIESCTETEKTHAILEALLPKDVYFRLQPINEVFDFPLDETKIEKLDAAQVVLDAWMLENDELFHRIADALLAGRTFDDEENIEADLRSSSEWPSTYQDSRPASQKDHGYGSDGDIAPSPLRPIHSKTSLLDTYSPLDDLEQWDDDM